LAQLSLHSFIVAPQTGHHLHKRPGPLAQRDPLARRERAPLGGGFALGPGTGVLLGGNGQLDRRDRGRHRSRFDDALRRRLLADDAQHVVAGRPHHDQVARCLGLELVDHSLGLYM
jgi:hypothetical protein